MAGGVCELVFAGAAAGTACVAAVAGVALLIGAGAAASGVAYQSLTPPWPLQAPLLDTALVEVPSLHVPVAAAGTGGVAAVAGEYLLMGVAAVGAMAPVAAYQSLTPPWPLHAPLLEAALVEVPSLHVPVAAAAGLAAALAAAGSDLLLLLLLPEEEPWSELLAAGAALLAVAGAPYHFLTPSCPLHAPLFEAAEV